MKRKKCESVAVLTLAPFPNGNVSTLRYSSYLKALAQRGVDSHVIIYCPTTMASRQKEASGVIDDISFQYATRITWKRGDIIEKLFFLIIGLFKSAQYLFKVKPDAIILYGDNNLLVVFFFYLISIVANSKYVGDRSELPSLEERNSRLRLGLYEFKQRFYDGMIIMTKQLMQYYSKFSKKKDFLFFMPMTIDVKRFLNIEVATKNYIAVVFGTHNRDGLEETLLAYNRYKKDLDGKFELMLIGDYERMPNKDKLDMIINSSSYKDQIIKKGFTPLEEMPMLLSSASCLITTPREYVSGGFPTKLGEYMLSGTPIVATIAGEMLDYIEPNVDMLMSNPGDELKIAQNLKYIETHPVEAKILSENAHRKAETFFNAENYMDGLLEFLSN